MQVHPLKLRSPLEIYPSGPSSFLARFPSWTQNEEAFTVPYAIVCNITFHTNAFLLADKRRSYQPKGSTVCGSFGASSSMGQRFYRSQNLDAQRIDRLQLHERPSAARIVHRTTEPPSNTPLTPSAFSPSQIPESSSAQSATMANHSCDRPVLQSAQYPVHYRCPSSQGATVPVDPAQRPGLPICRHTATEQSGSTHVNNSSGTLNRVGGDQRVNANNVRTLLNCEGTTVQLVVVSGAMLGDVGTTDEVPSPQGYGAGGGESNPNSRTDNQRLEDLRSDVEWMMDELQVLRQRFLDVEIANRRLEREVLRRRGRRGEEGRRREGGRSHRRPAD
ncbi:hypothetical protein AB1N83_011989 [Pleurotus pulmonarius]